MINVILIIELQFRGFECGWLQTEHINTVCGQNVELLNVKLAVHIVTTGL